MAIDPVTQGALISTGGSLLGGLIGGKDAKKAVKKQYKYQKEFAQNQLQWRVQDAKAAGLHPLFALGGGGGTSPTFMAGQSPMGSAIADSAAAIGSAVSSRPTELAKQLQTAQIQSINSQTERNQAEAALARSQAARVAQTANVTPSVASQVVDEALAPKTLVGRTNVQAAEVTAHRRGDESRTAGRNPAFGEMVVGYDKAGRAITAPVAGGKEATEEGGAVGTMLTLMKMLGMFDEKPPKFVQHGSREARRYQKRYQGKWSWHPNSRR